MRVKAFSCSVHGFSELGNSVLNAVTIGQAKVRYWRRVVDAWDGVPFTAIRARVVGEPFTDDAMRRIAEYRLVPFARAGMRVVHGANDEGVLVGSNSSANFDVLFTSGRFKGQVLNCHPRYGIAYFADDGAVLADFRTVVG